MATRRSRKDVYARLISYLDDCAMQSRQAVKEVMDEYYPISEYKSEYQKKMRRIEEKLEKCTSRAIEWKNAIRNVPLEYYIQLNALYRTMLEEFEYFEVVPSVIEELEAEIKRLNKNKSFKKMDPGSCVYEKTMSDYCLSIANVTSEMYDKRIIRMRHKYKYGSFDTHAFNVQMRKLYDEELSSNEVFNSYKLDSLTSKRSFTYIKNLVGLMLRYQSYEDSEYDDLYLMSYTTPRAMVSIKLDSSQLTTYAEIRLYDAKENTGYKEVTVPITMQSDLYKLYQNFGFSARQRSDASLKYQRILEIFEKFDEEE